MYKAVCRFVVRPSCQPFAVVGRPSPVGLSSEAFGRIGSLSSRSPHFSPHPIEQGLTFAEVADPDVFRFDVAVITPRSVARYAECLDRPTRGTNSSNRREIGKRFSIACSSRVADPCFEGRLSEQDFSPEIVSSRNKIRRTQSHRVVKTGTVFGMLAIGRHAVASRSRTASSRSRPRFLVSSF